MPNTLSLVVPVLFGLTQAAAQGPQPAASPEARVQRLQALLHGSQSGGDEALERVRLDFQRDPRAVLTGLVAALADTTTVPARQEESTMYTVSGNALTVLEDLTDLRLDPTDREWIGFRVHDHRGLAPETARVQPPWEAWLRTREGTPPETWFFGLSARELHLVQRVLRANAAGWTDEMLAPVHALGARVHPFLLHALLDGEWACEGERHVDQANRLLARLHGRDPEPIERYDLLTLDPADPLRAQGIALVRNRVALHAAHERWSVRLLAPR